MLNETFEKLKIYAALYPENVDTLTKRELNQAFDSINYGAHEERPDSARRLCVCHEK